MNTAKLLSRNLTVWQRIGLPTGVLIALILPFLFDGFTTYQFSLVGIYAIAILGLNILTGFNGQFSLGHSAFFALGAYTAAILVTSVELSPYLCLPIAACTCFVAGYLFGFPALKLKELYLALATFGLAIAMPQILKSSHLEHLTGGVQGITLTRPEAPFGLPLTVDQWWYLVVLATLGLTMWTARNLLNSDTGRAMRAIRDNAIAAPAFGIDVAKTKTLSFGISALYTGLAGALSAIVVEFVAPDSFTFHLSILLLIGMVIGGTGSITGSIFGGMFVLFVPNLSEELSKGLAGAIFGGIILLVIYLMPSGAAGLMQRLKLRIATLSSKTQDTDK